MSIPPREPNFTMADLEIWVQDDDGNLIIFTRGEYRGRLMEGIEKIGTPKHFGRVKDEDQP